MAKTTTNTAPKTETLDAATENLTQSTKVATNLFGAFAESGKKAFSGVLEFDKAVFGLMKDSFTGYVDHGKATLAAKNVNDALELQTAYAHTYIEATAANTRELLDLAKTKSEEAYTPVKDAIAGMKQVKTAA